MSDSRPTLKEVFQSAIDSLHLSSAQIKTLDRRFTGVLMDEISTLQRISDTERASVKASRDAEPGKFKDHLSKFKHHLHSQIKDRCRAIATDAIMNTIDEHPLTFLYGATKAGQKLAKYITGTVMEYTFADFEERDAKELRKLNKGLNDGLKHGLRRFAGWKTIPEAGVRAYTAISGGIKKIAHSARKNNVTTPTGAAALLIGLNVASCGEGKPGWQAPGEGDIHAQRIEVTTDTSCNISPDSLVLNIDSVNAAMAKRAKVVGE